MASKKPIQSSRGRNARTNEAFSSSPHSEFSPRKALFEIAVVAVGVLLALGVDEIRQSRADRTLVNEIEQAMRTEVEQNRMRLVTKLAMVHSAYQALNADPAMGPALVDQRVNVQVEPADAAWTMAQQTGALRLMDGKERQAFAAIYTSHQGFSSILIEEMNHWTDLAASNPEDRSVRIWKAYARRISASACISLMRIERFRNPEVPTSRLQQGCANYGPSLPPEVLYQRFGLDMPGRWQLGSD